MSLTNTMDFGELTLLYHRHACFRDVLKLPFRKLIYNELTLVIEGTMRYTVDGKDYTFNTGDIVFVKTGSTRIREESSSCNYVSFNFYSEKPINCFEIQSRKAIDNEIKALLKYYDVCTTNHLNHIDKKCTDILTLLLLCLYEFYNSPKYSKITFQIIQYLKNNIQKQITLHDIKEQVFFSPYYFCKKFKKETGLSIIQYFNTMKIEQAKTLIFEDVLPLEQIALQLGFSDYNYFSRLFKKVAKCSPTQFKSQYLATPQINTQK